MKRRQIKRKAGVSEIESDLEFETSVATFEFRFCVSNFIFQIHQNVVIIIIFVAAEKKEKNAKNRIETKTASTTFFPLKETKKERGPEIED